MVAASSAGHSGAASATWEHVHRHFAVAALFVAQNAAYPSGGPKIDSHVDFDSKGHSEREDSLSVSWSAAMWASGPAAAARPVEAGLGPARDGWPPTSALALLVKMAAVAIAATKVVSSLRRLLSVVCCRISHTRAPRDPRRSARA